VESSGVNTRVSSFLCPILERRGVWTSVFGLWIRELEFGILLSGSNGYRLVVGGPGSRSIYTWVALL
jgi:hypothetical protein